MVEVPGIEPATYLLVARHGNYKIKISILEIIFLFSPYYYMPYPRQSSDLIIPALLGEVSLSDGIYT